MFQRREFYPNTSKNDFRGALSVFPAGSVPRLFIEFVLFIKNLMAVLMNSPLKGLGMLSSRS